jgi:hypothetical protein
VWTSIFLQQYGHYKCNISLVMILNIINWTCSSLNFFFWSCRIFLYFFYLQVLFLFFFIVFCFFPFSYNSSPFFPPFLLYIFWSSSLIPLVSHLDFCLAKVHCFHVVGLNMQTFYSVCLIVCWITHVGTICKIIHLFLYTTFIRFVNKVSIFVNNNWIIQITIILKNGHKKKMV